MHGTHVTKHLKDRRRLAVALFAPAVLIAVSIFAAGGRTIAASATPTITAAARVAVTGKTSPPLRGGVPAEADQAGARRRLADALAPLPPGAKLDARLDRVHALMARVQHQLETAADDYVLTTAAIDTARDAHDLYLCFRLIDDLALEFDLDAATMKADAAARVAAVGGDANTNGFNYEAVNDLSTELVNAGNYEAAAKIANAATTFAAATGDGHLMDDARSLFRDVGVLWTESRELEHYRRTLSESPDDPDANSAVGKDLAFAKWDWDAAAPLLRKGSDRALAAVVRAKGRLLPTPAIKLAGLWWDASMTETNPVYRDIERSNAADLYREALGKGGSLDPAQVALANDRIDHYERFDAPKVHDWEADLAPTRHWYVVQPDLPGQWVPLDFRVEAGHAYRVIAYGRWQTSTGIGCGPDGIRSVVTVTGAPPAAAAAPDGASLAHPARGALLAHVLPTLKMGPFAMTTGVRPIEFAVGSDTIFIAPDSGSIELRMNDDDDGPGVARPAGRQGVLAVEVGEVREQLFPPDGAIRVRAAVDSDITLVIGDGGARWETSADGPVAPQAGTPAPPLLCGGILWLPRWGAGGRSDTLKFNAGAFPVAAHLAAGVTRGASITLEHPDGMHVRARVRPSLSAPFAPADVRFMLTSAAESLPATAPEKKTLEGPVPTTAATAAGTFAATIRAIAEAQAAEDAGFAWAERRAHEAEPALGIHLTRLSTEHTVIYTDCDSRQFASIRAAAEQRLVAVGRELRAMHITPRGRDRVPVFVFSRMSELRRFESDVEGRAALEDGAWGYYLLPASGDFGYVATYRPPYAADAARDADNERGWNYNLSHEFTHALVARYHPGRALPRWADEGLAEYVASEIVPRTWSVYKWVQGQVGADSRLVLKAILTGERPTRGFDDYPVYQTLIATLYAMQPDAFPGFISDLKDGKDAEAALKARYRLRAFGLEERWMSRIAEWAQKGQ